MKEFVTANGRTFECTNVATGLNTITLTMENQNRDELETFFRTVTGLTVSMEGEGEPHGVYTEPDYVLKYKSITSYEDGTVAVTMHMKDEEERRLDALEESQAEQDTVIAEIMYGN